MEAAENMLEIACLILSVVLMSVEAVSGVDKCCDTRATKQSATCAAACDLANAVSELQKFLAAIGCRAAEAASSCCSSTNCTFCAACFQPHANATCQAGEASRPVLLWSSVMHKCCKADLQSNSSESGRILPCHCFKRT